MGVPGVLLNNDCTIKVHVYRVKVLKNFLLTKNEDLPG